MSQACPLLFRQVDASISKISAIIISIAVILYLITMQKVILAFIIIDFFIRLSNHKSYSVVFRFACLIKGILNIQTRLEDAGAKRLAAVFGLVFSIGMMICDIAGLVAGVWFIAFIFLACIVLDLCFDYCIACKVYSIARRIYPKGFV
jgi:hypothetical protein